MYNQHTRGIATTRHRSLVERGGRKAVARNKGLAHTQKKEKKEKYQGKTDIHEAVTKILHIKLPAKLLDYFL